MDSNPSTFSRRLARIFAVAVTVSVLVALAIRGHRLAQPRSPEAQMDSTTNAPDSFAAEPDGAIAEAAAAIEPAPVRSAVDVPPLASVFAPPPPGAGFRISPGIDVRRLRVPFLVLPSQHDPYVSSSKSAVMTLTREWWNTPVPDESPPHQSKRP